MQSHHRCYFVEAFRIFAISFPESSMPFDALYGKNRCRFRYFQKPQKNFDLQSQHFQGFKIGLKKTSKKDE